MSQLAYAREYVSIGFSVIPIKPGGKTPSIDWKEYQDRKPEDAELVRWFGNGSKNNIGVVTGAISGVAVVDMDSKQAIEFARAQNFPVTPLVKSGKGFHAYYRYREGVRNFQKRDDLPDIDLRGDGGYVVAPPSIHPSGVQYLWKDGKGLDDLPLSELPELILAKAPEDKTPLTDLYEWASRGLPDDDRPDWLLPVDAAFPGLPRLDLDARQSLHLRQGRVLPLDWPAGHGLARAYDGARGFLGLVEPAEGGLRVARLFVPGVSGDEAGKA